MQANCAFSGRPFNATDKDLAFYEKISPTFQKRKYSIPAPTLCPEERFRRRQTWRNQRELRKRKCSLCHQDIVSIYPPETSFPVYCPNCWWGDRWDPFSFGRDFDFSQSFFSQLLDLQNSVPRISLVQLGEMENSDFTHDALRLKDSYLIFDGEQSRNCCYGETFYKLEDCFDFLDLQNCELCYECIACEHCYQLAFSHNCFQCSHSWFLRDCRGCKNCFGCANLHQKQYHIYNIPHSKEDYEHFINAFQSNDVEALKQKRAEAQEVWTKEPVRFMRGTQNENVSGDYLSHSKDSFFCFNSKNLRDCKYCTNVLLGGNDCYDIDVWGNGAELCYESTCIGENVKEVLFCLYVSHGAEKVYYSQFCSRQVRNLFGCIGLRKTENCILNKQYSTQEYEELAPQIIQHMQKSKEWGEYFPATLSPFAYNETVAGEYHPMSKEEVLKNNWNWNDQIKNTRKQFKHQKMELDFYRKMNLPSPTLHPDIRHQQRLIERNPRELWLRECATCKQEIHTNYAPSRLEQVMCESCYRKINE